ncbi:hypothetical protein DNTS_031306, partial [Danionella cerebrum]
GKICLETTGVLVLDPEELGDFFFCDEVLLGLGELAGVKRRRKPSSRPSGVPAWEGDWGPAGARALHIFHGSSPLLKMRRMERCERGRAPGRPEERMRVGSPRSICSRANKTFPSLRAQLLVLLQRLSSGWRSIRSRVRRGQRPRLKAPCPLLEPAREASRELLQKYLFMLSTRTLELEESTDASRFVYRDKDTTMMIAEP